MAKIVDSAQRLGGRRAADPRLSHERGNQFNRRKAPSIQIRLSRRDQGLDPVRPLLRRVALDQGTRVQILRRH